MGLGGQREAVLAGRTHPSWAEGALPLLIGLQMCILSKILIIKKAGGRVSC